METFIILLNILLLVLIINYFFIQSNNVYEAMACSSGKQNKVSKQEASVNQLYGEVNRVKSNFALLQLQSNNNRALIQENKSKNRTQKYKLLVRHAQAASSKDSGGGRWI